MQPLHPVGGVNGLVRRWVGVAHCDAPCQAGLDGDPASREKFDHHAGFEIGLGTTASLFGLRVKPGSNLPLDDPHMTALSDEAG